MNEKNTVLIEDFEDDAETDFQEGEILSETKAEIITEADDKVKELSGINALLANLPGDTDVSIIVTRLNDRQFRNQFRLPCSVDSKVEVVAWDGEAYPDSIYEYIQKKFGGGHYRFQLRYNGGFKEAWKDVLSDPAEPSEKEKLLFAQIKEKEPVKIEQPQTTFQSQLPQQNDSIDKIFEHFEKLERFKQLVSPPAPQIIEQPTIQPVTMDTIKMELIQKALVNPDLVEMAIRSVFNIKPENVPEKEETPGFWGTVAEGIAGAINTPVVKTKLGEIISGGLDLGTSLASNILIPKIPTQQPTQTPSTTLDSFRANPNPSPPDSPPENEPHAQETQNEPLVIDSPFQFIPMGVKNDD